MTDLPLPDGSTPVPDQLAATSVTAARAVPTAYLMPAEPEVQAARYGPVIPAPLVPLPAAAGVIVTPQAPAVPVPAAPPSTVGAPAVRRLLLFLAVAGLVVGAAGLRTGVLLRGRIDPDLITTPEAAFGDTVATVGRIVILVLLVGSAITVRPWLRGVRASLGELWARDAIGTTTTGPDGTVRRRPAADNPRLLFAPVSLPARDRWWEAGVKDATRTAVVALVLGAVALALVAIPSLGLLVVGSRELGSALWLAIGVGGFLFAPAGGLLAWVVADIDRREAAAIHAADPRRLPPPDPEHRWAAAAIAALAAVAIALPAATASEGFENRVCVAAGLDCRWMVVQADQLSSDPRGETTDLSYGLWRATGTRRGTMVIAAGGPGISGMASWERAYESMDPKLTAAYDIVAFDARGVGQSGFVDCPVASGDYWDALTFDASPAVIDAFVTLCLAEAGVDRSRLAMYASAQVAEDIDTIRQDLGIERIVLYGESYGTAVAQRYALAHPDRLDALILDGPLDIAQSTDGFWAEAAASFEDVLERTFRFCRTDDWCHDEMPDPGGAWRRLMATLAEDPVVARYADETGAMTTWDVDQGQAIAVLGDALYDPFGRMQVLRALAAAERDDWVPLARLVHAGSTFAYAEISASDFAYHATWCADRVVDADDAAGTGPYLAAAHDSPLAAARLGSVFLSGAACHAWPLAAAPAAPGDLPAGSTFPVFVLTATGDPITPPEIGRRIADRYDATTDVYLIQTTDGPHVTFGRGVPCPDDTILGFLVEGKRPLTREMHCPGELVNRYTGLVTKGADEDGATYRARALDIELFAHPDYLTWDGVGELAIGCRFGGRLVVRSHETADQIEVDRCEVVEASPMTGTGEYRDDGSARFEVSFPRGRFEYDVASDGTFDIEGTFDGDPIEAAG